MSVQLLSGRELGFSSGATKTSSSTSNRKQLIRPATCSKLRSRCSSGISRAEMLLSTAAACKEGPYRFGRVAPDTSRTAVWRPELSPSCRSAEATLLKTPWGESRLTIEKQAGLTRTKGRTLNGRVQASASVVASPASGDPQNLSESAERIAVNNEALDLAAQSVLRRRSLEQRIERTIVNCRFFVLFAVCGSLIGSLICFLKGSWYVGVAVKGYFLMLLDNPNRCKIVLKLIEALDTYLVGTVMLIFGMGLFELFVMKLDGTVDAQQSGSTLFGLFPLEKRPPWLAVKSLDDLKTKLGHVIVMILLVGMFEKSKIVHPTCSMDLFLTAGAVLLCAGSLFLLNRLKPEGKQGPGSAPLH